jgi:hypothetical protein
MKPQNQTIKAVLRKKNKVGGITFLNLKLYYKAIVIKIVNMVLTERNSEQWNRIASSGINPSI